MRHHMNTPSKTTGTFALCQKRGAVGGRGAVVWNPRLGLAGTNLNFSERLLLPLIASDVGPGFTLYPGFTLCLQLHRSGRGNESRYVRPHRRMLPLGLHYGCVARSYLGWFKVCSGPIKNPRLLRSKLTASWQKMDQNMPLIPESLCESRRKDGRQKYKVDSVVVSVSNVTHQIIPLFKAGIDFCGHRGENTQVWYVLA